MAFAMNPLQFQRIMIEDFFVAFLYAGILAHLLLREFDEFLTLLHERLVSYP
jgi:hypothetical protein